MRWQRTLAGKLVYWLVLQVPVSYLRLTVNLPRLLVEIFGLEVHARYLLVPMFHDSSWLGKGLSVFFRLGILFTGSVLTVGVAMFLWLLIPLSVWLPYAGLTESGFWWVIWLGLIGTPVVWRIVDEERPWGSLGGEFSEDDLVRALPGGLRNLVIGYPDNLSEWWKNRNVRYWSDRMELNIIEVESKLRDFKGSQGLKQQLEKQIFYGAKEMGTDYPEVGEVMWGLWQADERFRKVLEEMSVEKERVKEVAVWLRRIKNWTVRYPLWDERYRVKKLAGVNRAMTGTPTRILNMFSYDLTANADRLPWAVDREEAKKQLLSILNREGNKHVMVVGDTGCGKTTFIGGLAQTIMQGDAPGQIANKRLVKLEPGRLSAGARSQGDLTDRLVGALEDVKRSEDIILFIDEVHTMVTEQASISGLNLFTVLEEFLFEREVQMIGATTMDNYKKYLEPNEAFTRLFELVKLEEPDDTQALEILENIVLNLEKKHGVMFSLLAIKSAIKLARRYIHDRVLPDKAKSLLDEAGLEARENGKWVNAERVAKVVTRITGVPVMVMKEDERKLLLNLEKELHKEYVDQELAVRTLADAMRRGRTQVGDENRPVGTFIFVGPTGVGKTELARRLSEVYFGSESAMIRLDMGEFGSAEMINRLIGAAPGEAGYGEGGELTERVRRQASAVVLLDEIEKAHPKVWDLLMQVIDEGKMRDAAGLSVDFTNTIIIATSNAVTDFISSQLKDGKKLEDLRELIFDELLKTFRIEFLNRFDGIIPFGPLGEAQMEKIVRIQLNKLAQRLKEKYVEVEYTNELIEKLVIQGTDARLGARPLRRLIVDKLESYLARVLLKRDGDKKVVVKLGREVI
jgi:ATP-dependent Clp protease ATP-binding subunit ClpC